jgi:pimeloyl-ACP methyl ester carboxylesterase
MAYRSLTLAALLLAAACGHGPSVDAVTQGAARAPDGVDIRYDVRGRGDPALVFVHCWACDRSFWREQLDVFAADYRVVALDLGGHGASGTDRDHWTIAGLAGDVQAVVEQLGLDRIILVGHSMGGPVSLEAASRMADRVRAVVSVDTLHDAELVVPEEVMNEMATRFETDFEATMTGAIRSMTEGAAPALVEWILSKGVSVHRAPVVALLRDFRNVDLKRMLSLVKVPVRSINAAPGRANAPPTAIETNRKYADFDAILMEGVGHFLMLERPGEFNARLREVLDELSRRGDPEAGRRRSPY